MKNLLRAMTIILIAMATANSFAADAIKSDDSQKVPVSQQASAIKWENYTPDVFSTAKAVNHPVLLFVMAEGCHWCHEMQEKTFPIESVSKYINENFYPVILHADVDSEAADKYQITGVPVVMVFDADGKPIKIQEGFIDQKALITFLKPGIPESNQKK